MVFSPGLDNGHEGLFGRSCGSEGIDAECDGGNWT